MKSGIHLLSTGNEIEKLCQESPIDFEGPSDEVLVPLGARSLNTYIFMIDKGSTAIQEQRATAATNSVAYYDLHGRRLQKPHGMCIELRSDGSSRKIAVP